MSRMCIAVVAYVLMVQPAQAVQYTLTELAGEPFSRLQPTAINDTGQIVGTYLAASKHTTAFIHDGIALVDLGPMVGASSIATDINNQGQIAGYYRSADSHAHAFVYSFAEGLREIGPADMYGRAHAVADTGQIVGEIGDWSGLPPIPAPTNLHAFSDQGGVLRDLGAAALRSSAIDVNEVGQILGMIVEPDTASDYCVFEPDGTIRKLGLAPPSKTVFPVGGYEGEISDSGVIVGNSGSFGFWYDGVGPVHTLYGWASTYNTSWANAVNNAGAAVGAAAIEGSRLTHAFIYENGQMRDLNDLLVDAPGWELLEATDINNLGQIVGVGANGRGVLLTPVPEPTTVLLLVFGLSLSRRRAATRG